MLKDRQNQAQLEKFKQTVETRVKVADRLVESWSRTTSGAKLADLAKTDKVKARNAALNLQNQAKYMNRMSEATIRTQFNTVPENVLKIVRIGTTQSNRGNFLHEWPLITTDDAIYFVDRVYAPAEATAQTASGGNLRGGTANSRIYETIAPQHATESYTVQVHSGSLAANAAINFTLAPQPIVPLWIQIRKNGALIGRDNGQGGFTSTDPTFNTSTTVSNVNYASGVSTFQFTSALPAGTTVEVEFSWDSEVKDNYDEYGRVDIKVDKKRFNARPFPLGYSFTKMVELTLSSTSLGSAEDILIRAVGDEHAMRKDFQAVRLALSVARGNPITYFDADHTATGDDNYYNHAQRITTTLKGVGGQIFDDIGRGVVNKLVVGSQLAAYLEIHTAFKVDETQPRVGATYLSGRLGDIEVYVCRSKPSLGLIADNQALAIYRNPDEEGDVAIAFGVLTELAAALDYPEFLRVGNIGTVEDKLVINSKFIRLVEVNNLQ
jgi:hypothetical protein